MGEAVDQAPACYEHVWALKGIHLSLLRGVEQEEECGRCGAARYLDDQVRNDPRRPKLQPTRRLRGE